MTEAETGKSWNYSEYLPRKNEIVLYKEKIMSGTLPEDERYEKYQEYEMRRELFIAHEIFHYLEHTDAAVKTFRSRYAVTVLDLKFFRLTRELVSMSEIGAYGFTRAFFGIGEDSTDSEFCEGKVIE